MEQDLMRIKALLQEFIDKYPIEDICVYINSIAYCDGKSKKTINIEVEV